MSLFVKRISRPHSDARLLCRFAHQLTVRSGVTVGARRSAGVRGQWQIVWYDGPTVIAMRRHAADLGRAVVGVDLDRLTWQRTMHAAPTRSSTPSSAPVVALLEPEAKQLL